MPSVLCSRIFEEGGLGESTSLLSSIGIGLTNLIFTLIGVSLIDKLGRRKNVLWLFWLYHFSFSACILFRGRI